MLKNRLSQSLLFITLPLSCAVSAFTLEHGMKEVLVTHPVVQERLKNYRATVQDLRISESGYYPKLDLISEIGYESRDARITNFIQEDYRFYENSLVLSQNLFNGFSTSNQVDFQQQRILAAANNYIEKVNDTAFNLVNQYLQVLRNRELMATAQDNVKVHEDLYSKVNELYKSGQTSLSEVKKINSSLSSAQSDLVVQHNNLMDASFNLRRVLGRRVESDSLVAPQFEPSLPANLEEATSFAITNNPAILTSNHNVEASQLLRKERENNYYPHVDLQVSKGYDRIYNDNFGGRDNDLRASVMLSWNLYNGGADSAEVQKQVSKINQEYELKRELKRQVIEGLELSWSAYTMVDKQLKHLFDYRNYSENTLSLYQEEYNFGRRTLLDLLAAQRDFNSAQAEIITAKYSRLFARYRIMDAMGTMVISVLGDSDAYRARVGLDDKKPELSIDKLPLSYDGDKDRIVDSADICDNSQVKNNIQAYGCVDNSAQNNYIHRFGPFYYAGDVLSADSRVKFDALMSLLNGRDDVVAVEIISHAEQSAKQLKLSLLQGDVTAPVNIYSKAASGPLADDNGGQDLALNKRLEVVVKLQKTDKLVALK